MRREEGGGREGWKMREELLHGVGHGLPYIVPTFGGFHIFAIVRANINFQKLNHTTFEVLN